MNDQFGSALAAIRANRLRSVLTISIIAIGVTALVGIETAIGVLSRQLSESFGRMGSGTLSLVPEAEARPFSWHEASTFAESFADSDEGQVSLSAEITPMAVITADGKRTDPMVSVLAADVAWLPISARTLSQGRNFTARESTSGSAVCLIGHSLARRLFGNDAFVIGKTLSFSGMPYSVIGVLAARGSLLGGGSDYRLVLPLQTGREWMPEDAQWQITLLPEPGLENLLEESARTRMRALRRRSPGAADDFQFRRSDTLQSRLDSLEKRLSLAALAIGLITLLGAAVALMNILLVSVKERTGEIGLRKALGEKVSSIRRSFLAESILIGQIGGLAGIVLGLLAGAIVALTLGGGWHIPWGWLAAALALCVGVSLLAGTLPARRAAALQPVDALRGR